MQCALLQLEPVVGVALLARIQVEADRLHREARRKGSTEPWAAHAADAVASILASGLGWTPPAADAPAAAGAAPDAGGAAGEPAEAAGEAAGESSAAAEPAVPVSPSVPAVSKSRGGRRADVVFVVDLRTFRSGAHPESMCHVVGGGPVPAAVVREMAKDAFLKVVFHDGVNIHTVTHVGRYQPAELRTALELGGPPDFDGVRCSECGNRFGLEWDHVEPICVGGVTSFANEDAKCWRCHDNKSRRERQAGVYDRRTRSGGACAGPDPP